MKIFFSFKNVSYAQIFVKAMKKLWICILTTKYALLDYNNIFNGYDLKKTRGTN